MDNFTFLHSLRTYQSITELKLRPALKAACKVYGSFYEAKDGEAERHVDIIPLYALSNLNNLNLLKSPNVL